MDNNLLSQTETLMKGRLEKFRSELANVRTGRANPQILESVRVEYYGQNVPIKQVAAITVPEGRTLEIRPWDPTQLEAIDKALQKSDIGVPPQNDGKSIRLQMPSMTEDRRKDLVKSLGKVAEEARVAMRTERRDAIEKAKKAEKDKQLAEDERKKLEESIQKLTDSYIKKVDELLAQKEKEIVQI
ncbi:MAG: ribosome recycling factor [Elusimicrobia bacterium]|nr:ribosome recycling factor [Elusimicrobiota bacterium]